MLFDGKAQNQSLLPYFLALMGLVPTAWGFINFFFGGLKGLADTIDDGALEPMIGTPRRPLLLVALSYSNSASLGDILQGLISLGALFWAIDPFYAFRTVLVLIPVTLAFFGLFIFAGSMAFFLQRGASISVLLIESTLSLTMYPAGKSLQGPLRFLLYFTPAWLIAILPLDAVESASWGYLGLSFFLSGLFFFLSLKTFERGLKRYRSGCFVGAFR